MSRHARHETSRRSPAEPNQTNLRHPSEEEVRIRAFEKYCGRNGEPGDSLNDWIEAERELAEECSFASAMHD